MTSSDYGLPDQPDAMERLCASLCNHANDAVVLTDSDRRILWCNRAFEELTGYTLAELAGRDKDALYDAAGESALTGPRYGGPSGSGLFPMRLRRKDGASIATEMATWPWAMSDGRLAGHFAICRDTTEEDRQHLARDSFVAILTDQRLDERTKIEAILALACDYFKMPVALVCALEGQTMSVVHAKSSLMTVSPGTRFDLGQSMCSTTLAVDGPHNFANTVEIGENPTFLSYGLRSYIGKKLSVGGHTFGTLSLCSPLDRPHFTRQDSAMITLLASGIEQLLATEMRVQALESAATLDWLTGASTSRQFRQHLEDTFAQVRRNAATASLILFDVDHFKSINDQFGHDMGDRALTEIARRARRVIGPNRKLYRVGGEEFAVILAGSGADSAAIMAERLRKKVSEQQFNDDLPLITASFGVAELDEDLGSADAWLKCADISLYASKNNGRNRVTSNRSVSGIDLPDEVSQALGSRQTPGSKRPLRV